MGWILFRISLRKNVKIERPCSDLWNKTLWKKSFLSGKQAAFMRTERNRGSLLFQSLGGREVVGRFDEGKTARVPPGRDTRRFSPRRHRVFARGDGDRLRIGGYGASNAPMSWRPNGGRVSLGLTEPAKSSNCDGMFAPALMAGEPAVPVRRR